MFWILLSIFWSHGILGSALACHHGSRTHLSLHNDAPEEREKESQERGDELSEGTPLKGSVPNRQGFEQTI